MKKIKGFTLIEMLVVVAIIALLISILLPSLSKARELSRRTVCGANVKDIGTTLYIYQGDNLDVFPTAPHATPAGEDQPIVEYIENMGGGLAGPGDPPRDVESSVTTAADDGSTRISTTRSFWLLVRSGEIVPKNFKCPSSEDTVDPTLDVTTYFDFIGFGTCSYGYQIPYDNNNSSKPSADVDPRMVLVADRGPWSSAHPDQEANGGVEDDPRFFVDTIDSAITNALYQVMTDPNADPIMDEHAVPDRWKRFNSPNHGGLGQGRGQNMLYPDAHAEFKLSPLGGVDSDNIYTQMTIDFGQQEAFSMGLQWGNLPEVGSNPIYPGHNSFGDVDSLTDTLIWP